MDMTATKARTSTRYDWEPLREVIRQLYVVEGKTLKDVISIMKERHGFQAT